jgi:hypothetical protein
MDPLQFELKFLENTDKHGFLTTPATTANIQDGAVTQAKLASGVSAITVCTSSTKPASPFTGQVIYMSDTDEMAIWDSAAWEGLNRSRDRNVIINGAMQVAQRGTSTASITTSNFYTADRWYLGIITLGTWTQSLENDAPTGSGLRKSWKVLCTTADASPAAGDTCNVQYKIEGQNLQQFAKGTASAKQFSLSFWVKSNKTGTYIAELYDADNTRNVSASYSVSAADTWEKKTITFPADTTGAFDNDNALSLIVTFHLAEGSDNTSGTLATTWASFVAANRAVGQTNLAAATNNYWQITGVQLEAGAVATPFEFEDYGATLAKCQRYYYRVGGNVSEDFYISGYQPASTPIIQTYRHPVVMRTTPSIAQRVGTWTVINSATQPTVYSASQDSFNVQVTVNSGISNANQSGARSASTSTYLEFGAEL